MTFKAYLAARKRTADSAGDIARLASADSFPDVSTSEDLQAYIIAHYGSGPLSDAVPGLWEAYETAKKKRREA
ncbi:MAG: hypothetical protein WEB56_13860 [Roseovarius sp.]